MISEGVENCVFEKVLCQSEFIFVIKSSLINRLRIALQAIQQQYNLIGSAEQKIHLFS